MSDIPSRLVDVRSQLAEAILHFASSALQRLDHNGFYFRSGGVSRPISISGSVIDAHVWTGQRDLSSEPRATDPDKVSLLRSLSLRRSDTRDPHEQALASLEERLWAGNGRRSQRWSRVFAGIAPHRPMVVRGAPGGGKTTLTRYSAIQELTALQDAVAARIHPLEQLKPILWITCSALAEAPGSSGNGINDTRDLAITASFNSLQLAPPSHDAPLRAWLRDRMAKGRCSIVLDSLDEMKPSLRGGFNERAARLLDVSSPLVLTCRVSEWEERRNWPGWPHVEEVELADFSPPEQERYARQMLERELNVAGIDEFLRTLRGQPGLKRACESPLLLFFACLLHGESDFQGIQRRVDLYQRMRRHLLRGYWRAHGAPDWCDGGSEERAVTDWLNQIAYALLWAKPEGKAFKLQDWEAAASAPQASAASKGRGMPSRATPKTLLDDLIRCGMVVAAGWVADQPCYSFLHRSILAFLAGAGLAAHRREDWLKETRDHLWCQPGFEDPLLFMAGHLGADDANSLLVALEEEPEDIFLQRLSWQWRLAAEAISVDEGWRHVWSDRLQQSLDYRSCPSPSAFRALLGAFGRASRMVPGPVSRVCALLEVEGPRHKIAVYLGLIGPDEALSALITHSDSAYEKGGEVRRYAAQALGAIGSPDALDALLRCLNPAYEPDALVRSAAAEALGKIGSNMAEDALMASLFGREHDGEVREHAAWALGAIGSSRVINTLVKCLREELDNDDYPVMGDQGWLVESIGDALSVIDSAPAVESLIASVDCTREPEGRVRRAAARALGVIKSVEAVAALRNCLDRDRSFPVRKAALHALGAIASPDAVSSLVTRLDPRREPDERLRSAAAVALGMTGAPEAMEPLLNHLDPNVEGNYEVRVNAATALGEIGAKEAVGALGASLERDRELTQPSSTRFGHENEYRRAAVRALGRIGSQDSLAPLTACLDSGREPDMHVREAAALALGSTRLPAAVEPLVRRLNARGERFLNVYVAAIDALGWIGSPSAVPALVACMDHEWLVKDAGFDHESHIAEALGAIGSEDAEGPLLSLLKRRKLATEPRLIRRRSPHDSVVRALGEIGSDSAVAPLRECLAWTATKIQESSFDPRERAFDVEGDALWHIYWRVKNRGLFLLEQET